MAWFGRRTRRVGRRGTATAAGAIAVAIGFVVAGPWPAAAQEGSAADDAAASSGALPGFVLREGRFSAFEAPEPDVAIYPNGINDDGEITGEYIRSDSESGLLRSPDGELTTFDVPGAEATEGSKINDSGQIVGRYSQDTPLVHDSSAVRGFVRDRNGSITRIDFPDAQHTMPTGINDRGDVVGYYVDDEDETHGFMWQDHEYTGINLVGVGSTMPLDINDDGQIVGLYLDDAGAAQGFLLVDDRYTAISPPGALSTVVSGINDDGEVVGYTTDDLLVGVTGGFRFTLGTDHYAPVAVPNAARTLPLGINDRGDVVGVNESPDLAASWPNANEEWTAMSAGSSDRLDLVRVGGIRVNAAIAGQVEAMLDAAEADGFALRGGGHRSPERQVELRRQNCGTSYYAIYEMPASQCSPPTARPGRSLHERGLAIDFWCDGELIDSRSDPCFDWLAANAEGFGFYNLASEPWHWSVTGQ